MSLLPISGLSELADDYDLFILDLWGVVHNGVTTFAGAADCMRRLRSRGARVVLLSNAPRPSDSVAIHLEELGVQSEMYDWLLTSGEATADYMAARTPQPAFFHLGPAERSRPTLAACGGREVGLEEAELILCTGLFDDETERAEDYRTLLTAAADRGLVMVCANPDVVVIRGEKMIQCAGAVAAFYEELGGEVMRFGKPFPEIFERLFAAWPEITKDRAVMVGDSLATDIRGARRTGIDSIWIAGGIHADELGLGPDGELSGDQARGLAEAAGERPRAVMPLLRW